MVGYIGHVLAIGAENNNFVALGENVSLNGALSVSLEDDGVSDRRKS